MVFRKLMLLLVVVVAAFVGYLVHKFWQQKIDPRASGKNFLLFMLVNMISVFVLVFLFGFIIIYFKGFFFKQ